VNLTAPFKTAALPAFTRLTPEARRIGAVNTAWISTDGWTGHNTDVEGVRAVLDSHAWRGTRAAVLGAGGAARAAVDALLGGVRELTVAARDPSRAAWAAALGARVTAWERPDAELVVDATSGDGRASAALGFGPSLSLWFDLSYAREATGPARAVRAHGARFVDGSAMLEEAAAASYRAFRRRDGAPSG
jgi:shikimate dehydrogenase